MNERQQELLKQFKKRNEELVSKEKLCSSLETRLFKAKRNITELEQEKTEIREQRPELLADGKSVDKLNKRLKQLDEEIELKEDEITGLKNKIPNLREALVILCRNTNVSFSQLVFCFLPELYPAYNELAEQFAEKVKEYWVLNYMSKDHYSAGYYHEESPGALGLIPSLPASNKAIFNKNQYDSSGIADKLRKRFNIPEYIYRNGDVYKKYLKL